MRPVLIVLLSLIGFVQAVSSAQRQDGAHKIFVSEGRYGLKVASTQEVVLPPVYEELGWTLSEYGGGDLLGYQENGKWGLVQVGKKALTDPIFYLIEPFSTNYIKVAVTKNHSNQLEYGLLDTKGKVKLSCKYFSLTYVKSGIIAGKYTEGIVRYGLLNFDFEEVVPTEFMKIEPAGDLFLAQHPEGNWSLYNSEGNVINSENFDSYAFVGDYLEIQKKGSVGLVDLPKRKQTLAMKFKRINYDGDSIQPVDPRVWQVYNRELRKVRDIQADSLSHLGSLIVSYLNSQQRVFFDSVEILPNSQFDIELIDREYFVVRELASDKRHGYVRSKSVISGDSIHFDGTYFHVFKDRKWQIVNQFGRMINDQPLDKVGLSQSLYVTANRNGQWGMYDFQGQLTLGFAYDSIAAGIDKSFPAKYVGSWGITDPYGNWLVKPAYERMQRVADFYVGERNGLKTVFSKSGVNLYVTAAVIEGGNNSIVIERGNDLGLIAQNGVVIFEPAYQSVQHNGDFFIAKKPTGSVIKNTAGEFILSLDQGVEEVYDWSEGFFHVRKNGMHGFVDEEGRIRVAHRYDSLRGFKEGMAAYMLRGKWGFMNVYEDLVVQPYYYEVADFKEGLAIVKAEKAGMVNRKGDLVMDLDFQDIQRTSFGSYILHYPNGKKGLADAKGAIRLSPFFEEMEDIGNGLIVVMRDGKEGLYNDAGELLVSFEFEEIHALGAYLAMTRDPGN